MKMIDVLQRIIKAERDITSVAMPCLTDLRKQHTKELKNLVVMSSVNPENDNATVHKVEVAMKSTFTDEPNPFALIKVTFDDCTLVYDECVGVVYELKNNQYIFTKPHLWFDFTPLIIGYEHYGLKPFKEVIHELFN